MGWSSRQRVWAYVCTVGALSGCAPEATDVGTGQQGDDRGVSVDDGALGDGALGDGALRDGAPGDGAAGGGGAGGDADTLADSSLSPEMGTDAHLPDAAVRDAGPSGAFEDPQHPCVFVVDLGSVQMFAYEASRPDATDAWAGQAPGACSRAGVLPAATVTLDEARAACAAVDYRLCTDAEWHLACAGPAGSRAWPYGDRHEPGRCNEHLSGSGTLQTTGNNANCVSREGVFDLSGNVWERTDDDFKRGASYKLNAVMFRTEVSGCNEPYDLSPAFADDDVGFRCCR